MKLADTVQTSECVALDDLAVALGISKRGAELRAARASWIFEEVQSNGGKKRYYPLASLPQEVVNAVHIQAMSAWPAVKPAAVLSAAPLPALSSNADLVIDPHSLTTHQLEVERARDRIFHFVEGFQGTTKGALAWLNDEKTAERLAGAMLWAYEHAWDKPRATNRLTAKTYYNWMAEKKERGRAAPKKIQKDMDIKPWHAIAVALVQRPQGSHMTWIAEQIAEQWNQAWGEHIPSKRAVEYFLKEKFSALDQLKGRHTGSALRAHMHYAKRTSAGMAPWDEIHADGWNTHFTAPHPRTGEFVTYEVWHAHDVATRVVPPFGIGLTENFEVIAACIEHTIRFGGVMAILMTDSTGIIKKSERLKTNEATSLAHRAGFTILHPVEVGNSQANGISENFNKYLDRCSRELATYQAKDMDSLTLKRVKKLTMRMVAAAAKGDAAERARLRLETEKVGKGKVFDTYAEAVAWLDDKREKFNNTPHSSLPKMRDPESGKMRHQSPYEALAGHRAAGWEPVTLAQEHLLDMFWQHVQRKVMRAAVTPYRRVSYHHPELANYEGKQVVVAFDENRSEQVWIKTLGGEIICEAKLREDQPYRGLTALETALERRSEQAIKRLDRKAELIRSRLPGVVIENEGRDVPEPPRLKTIVDFLDVESRPVEEPMLTAADFWPEPEENKEVTKSYSETVMWLHGKPEEEQEETKEGAGKSAAG